MLKLYRCPDLKEKKCEIKYCYCLLPVAVSNYTNYDLIFFCLKQSHYDRIRSMMSTKNLIFHKNKFRLK